MDVEYAKTKGIAVSNVPAYSTNCTSQYAIALMLEMTNQVGLHNASVHNGEWQNSRDFCFWKKPVIELADKTMGIIGLGSIGQQTAKTAKAMISVELSMGQMIEDVRLATQCRIPVSLCNRAGGMIPSPEQVLASIKKTAEELGLTKCCACEGGAN